MPITMADVGSLVSIKKISGNDEVKQHLAELGFGNWKPTVATVTGLVAKEQVVGTFGVLYAYDDEAEELGEEGEQIWDRVAADYTPIAAFGLGTVVGFIALGALLYLIFRKGYVATEEEKNLNAVRASA